MRKKVNKVEMKTTKIGRLRTRPARRFELEFDFELPSQEFEFEFELHSPEILKIRMLEKSFKNEIFKLNFDRNFDLSALKFSMISIYESNENLTFFEDDLHCLSEIN